MNTSGLSVSWRYLEFRPLLWEGCCLRSAHEPTRRHGEIAQETIERVIGLLTDQPELNEFKHTRLSVLTKPRKQPAKGHTRPLALSGWRYRRAFRL